MMKTLLIALISVTLAAGRAPAQEASEQLTVAMYAPVAAFADSSSRLAYIVGLAKAIQQKVGVPTAGKIYVRLGDLVAAKPDFAIVDGQCLSARAPGPILAAAVAGGDTQQGWGLYARAGETLASLRGKKLVYVRTGCRDDDFLDNAMLDGELRTASYFGALVDRPDVAGAIATVRDYKAADAVFAPGGQARGLAKVYDAGTVPNAGFVAMRSFPAPFLESVKQAVVGYGGGGGIDGWRAAAPATYAGLAGRLAPRPKRPVFSAPEAVRLEEQEILVLPPARYEQAGVKQHFWQPGASGE